MKHKGEKGFTLTELLFAMTLFSFVLLIISAGFIQVMRMYQSGLTMKESQRVGRSIIQQISQDMRTASSFSGENLSALPDECYSIGNAYYYWIGGADNLNQLYRVEDPENPSNNNYCQSSTGATPMVDDTRLEVHNLAMLPIYVSGESTPSSVFVGVVVGTLDNLDASTINLVDESTGTCNTDSGFLELCSVIIMRTALSLRGVQ